MFSWLDVSFYFKKIYEKLNNLCCFDTRFCMPWKFEFIAVQKALVPYGTFNAYCQLVLTVVLLLPTTNAKILKKNFWLSSHLILLTAFWMKSTKVNVNMKNSLECHCFHASFSLIFGCSGAKMKITNNWVLFT